MIATGENGTISAWFNGERQTIANNPTKARELLAKLHRNHFRIFSATKLHGTLQHLDARHFEAILQERRITSIKLTDGPKIYGTRALVPSTITGYQALLELWDYCQSWDVNLSSPSWTAEQFLRATLSQPLRFNSPINKGAKGARKGWVQEGTYTDIYYADIKSAYPSAMIAEPLPLSLKHTGSKMHGPVGLALAEVVVPEEIGRWSPVHEITRIGIAWHTQGRTVRGWYSFRELRTAQDVGCLVNVLIAFSGIRYGRPFDSWQKVMLELRLLDGIAGKWGKIIANSLWGSFANHGYSKRVTFADARGTTIQEVLSIRPPPPNAGFIATEVSGRVRDRIYRELVPSDPIYVDTDGGMVRAGHLIPSPAGNVCGLWEIRKRFHEVEIHGMGAYIGTSWNDKVDTVLAGWEGIASVSDVRTYGGTYGATDKTIMKVKVLPKTPWIFDSNGKQLDILPRWKLESLPQDWKAIPPLLADVPGYEPEPLSKIISGQATFPLALMREIC